MGRRGRKRQLEIEAEYWQLLKAGVGTVAACRLVGITRKTGYRGGPRTAESHRSGGPRRPRTDTLRESNLTSAFASNHPTRVSNGGGRVCAGSKKHRGARR